MLYELTVRRFTRIRLIFVYMLIAVHSIGQSDIAMASYCEEINNDTTRLCIWYHRLESTIDRSEQLHIARSSYDLAIDLLEDARYHESILYSALSSTIWLQLDSMERYGYCLVYTGRAKYRLGEMYGAFQASNNALLISQQGDFPVLASLAHRFLSWNYWRVKQCDEALNHIALYKDAIDNKVIPESSLGSYYNAMAKFNYCKGDLKLALSYSDSTYAQALKNDDPHLIALALSNKVNYLMGVGTMEERLKLVNAALEINIAMNDKEQWGSNLGLKANVYFLGGEYEKSIPPALESLEIAQEIGDKPRIIVAYDLLRRTYAKLEDFNKAYKYTLLVQTNATDIYGLKKMEKIFALEKEKAAALQGLEIQRLDKEKDLSELNLQREKQVYIILAVGSLLLLMILLWSWYKYRQSKEKESRMIEEVHAGELRKHELRSLRAMMNPHFIFNSLNSIKSYIIHKQSRTATDYLNKFSELIRLILHNSQLEQIALEEELKTLDLYIQMESMRLEGQFDYEITCDPDVHKNSVMIAPLIIQPFVENAIWHGLVHKEGDRSLKINVHKINDGISIHILDNGIGREGARLYSSKNPLKRKSYGIEITDSRIQFLSGKNRKKNTLQILDLLDINGEAAGTEAIIQIFQ